MHHLRPFSTSTIELITGGDWLPSMKDAHAWDYRTIHPTLDQVLDLDGANSRANDAADALPLLRPHIPPDAMDDPIATAGICLTLLALATEEAATHGQRAYGIRAMGDIASHLLMRLKRLAKQGDREAIVQLDRIATMGAGWICEVIDAQPEMTRAHYSKEAQMPFVVSPDRHVIREAEDLMEKVGLASDHFIRIRPASRRETPARRRTKSKVGKPAARGVKGDSRIGALMRPLLGHVVSLRSHDIRLAEPLPPEVAAIIALPELAKTNAKDWADTLYAWIEYMTDNPAHRHPVIFAIGESHIPPHIRNPLLHGSRATNIRHNAHKAAYIRRGVKKQMAEWLRDNFRE